MKELRMNLQGSWKRILAMITVAAMCFSVVSISPAFATGENAKDGVEFKADNTVAKSAVTIASQDNKTEIAEGETLDFTGTATIKTENEGDTVQANDYTVTWGSSDTEVATIEGQTVTAKKAGTTNITLKVQKGSEEAIEAEAFVLTVTSGTSDVTPAEVTTVEAVKVNKAATELTVGGTEKLTAEVTVSPADAAKPDPEWNSSNEKVAKVAADGTVTAIAEGTANITATAKIGDSEKLPLHAW